MIVRLSIWETIRDQFTDAEKDALNAAITGHAICPRGVSIDEDRLGATLREKIRRLALPATKQRRKTA